MAPAEVRSAVMGAADRKPAPEAELLVRRFTRRGVMQAALRPSGAVKAAAPAVQPRVAVTGRASPLTPTLAPAPAGAREVAAGVKARAAVAVVEAPAEAAKGDELDGAIVAELRGALRGRTAAELAELHGAPPARVEAILQQLAARGAVIARGPRWYVG
jgi:hypothetical protein